MTDGEKREVGECVATLKPGDVMVVKRDREGRWIVVTLDHEAGMAFTGCGATFMEAWTKEA